MLAGSDDKAHQKTVKTGIRQGEQVQILDGLVEGDRVVASGAYGLPDNT
jgi:multidrug efflux pump subunit AcrA (membrane-fusion protein)